MSLLHTPTHMAFSHEITHTQTHMHTQHYMHVHPGACIEWIALMQTHNIHGETSQGNQADRSKRTHTGMNLSERLKIYQRMFSYKPIIPAVVLRNDHCCFQLISEFHTMFLPRQTEVKSSALDIQSSFTEERNHFKNKYSIFSAIRSCVSNYTTTCHVRREFTVLFLSIFSVF